MDAEFQEKVDGIPFLEGDMNNHAKLTLDNCLSPALKHVRFYIGIEPFAPSPTPVVWCLFVSIEDHKD